MQPDAHGLPEQSIMPHPNTETFLMTPAAAEALAAGQLGQLSPSRIAGGESGSFAVLDQVTRPLLRTGRLLLETATGLTLLRPGSEAVELPGPRPGPFVGGFPEGELKKALGDLSPLRSLLPFGTGTARDQTLVFVDAEAKARCRMQIRILTAAVGAAVALVTLRPLRGYDKAFAALRAKVLAGNGESLEAARLFARLFPDQPVHDMRPALSLAPCDRAFDAAVTIVAAHLPAARASEAGVIADHDSEFLHDYRVALRRIRSVLGLFKGVLTDDQSADLKRRLAKLMAPTGRLRDLDVYLLERQSYYDRLPASLHGGLDAKFALLTRARAAERARLARHLRSPAYEAEIAALCDLFRHRVGLTPGPRADEPALDYACALIWKRYRRIGRLAAAIVPQTGDEEVHALRIECKKLRYLMESFAPLFGKEEFRALLRPLKALQDNLGLVNDCAVQQASLQEFLRGLGRKGDRLQLDVAQSVGALTAVLHRQQVEERARTLESLAGFTGKDVERRFRSLFLDRKEDMR